MKIGKRQIGNRVAGTLALCCVFALLVGAGYAARLSPVLEAARLGDVETLKVELRSGGDVNAAQGDGFTALHWAAKTGNRAVAEVLIAAGADIQATTRLGRHMPLHVAAAAGQAEVAETLLQAGSPVAEPTETGAQAIHFAATAGNAPTLGVLLSNGADVNAVEPQWGQTPLMFAASVGRAAAVEILMEAGADPSVTAAVLDVAARAEQNLIARRARQERISRERGGGADVIYDERERDKRAREAQRRARAAAAKAAQREGPDRRGPRDRIHGRTGRPEKAG